MSPKAIEGCMYVFPWNLSKDNIHLEGLDLGSPCQGESSRGAGRKKLPALGFMRTSLQWNIWCAMIKQESVFFFSPLVWLNLNSVSHSEDHLLVHCGDPGQCLAGCREHSTSLHIPYGTLLIPWNISLHCVRHVRGFIKDDDSDQRQNEDVNVIPRR